MGEKDEGLGGLLWLLELLHEGWIHGSVVLAEPLADEIAAGGGSIGGVDEAPTGVLWAESLFIFGDGGAL